MAATARRLSNGDVEYLIVLFQNETPLWDSSSVSYSNADARRRLRVGYLRHWVDWTSVSEQ